MRQRRGEGVEHARGGGGRLQSALFCLLARERPCPPSSRPPPRLFDNDNEGTSTPVVRCKLTLPAGGGGEAARALRSAEGPCYVCNLCSEGGGCGGGSGRCAPCACLPARRLWRARGR